MPFLFKKLSVTEFRWKISHATFHEGHEIVGGPGFPVGGEKLALGLTQPVHEGGATKPKVYPGKALDHPFSYSELNR